MRYSKHRQPKRGLTLVELLLVIGIIAILASLLLGAVYKAHAYAKDKAWRLETYNAYDQIRERLSHYCQSHTSYPTLTALDFQQSGVFDDRIMDFLSCPHVQFTPFSSGDMDSKVILRINNDWIEGGKPVPGQTSDLIMTKKQVTKPGESK